ncbi:MAG: hypothetical protein HF973_17345 [Chloroflexi bacterium]|nr:hypothetical protein [Chloroflexota bacterium]
MNDLGAYSFLPWLRQGIANQLQAGGAGAARATINVTLKLEGEGADGAALEREIRRDVQLYGPGDIIGIDRKAIIKTEPLAWITNFEPNYLPAIDFYDEDFPWRYTPETPDGDRLRPWIMLVVLKESEFEEGPPQSGRPLPFIKVTGADSLFPPIDQLWAWAHVHINRDLAANAAEIVSGDMAAVMPKFEALLRENPDLAYSRIICPRKLDTNSLYNGFLIPVFETGRLAGLGLDPVQSPSATHGAWQPDASKPEAEHFPYYFRWTFQTGTMGDFEYLVRLLEAKPVDNRVGQRDMDVQEPGSNLRGITDPELEGVLRLGGALRVPDEVLSDEEKAVADRYENWDQPDYPHPFQIDLAAFINLADDYQAKTAVTANTDSAFNVTMPDPNNPGEMIPDPDPLITPPLYGRWPALTSRLLQDRAGNELSPNDNWVHELNLDPRHRVTAGFGTGVVQKNQESYMNAAWEQIGDVLEANRRIRLAQLAKLTSLRWYTRYLLPLEQHRMERAFQLTMPVQRRVLTSRVTAYHRLDTSIIPLALTTTTLRRITRPRGRLMKALPFDDSYSGDNLISRVNAGEVTAAPPKADLDGAPSVDDLADQIEPSGVPSFVQDLLARFPNLLQIIATLLIALFILLLLVFIFLPGIAQTVILLLLIGGLGWAYYQVRQWQQQQTAADSIREENQQPRQVDELPLSPDFRLIEPGETFTPTTGDSDSVEAVHYKTALKETYTLLQATRQTNVPPKQEAIDLTALTGKMTAALNPAATIPRYVYDRVLLPPRIKEQIGEKFVEAMAYPEIDQPMYKPLVDQSVDNFLPNIQYVEQNSISLLETNQPFIEAYMVGLNHEFARELLWREYFTDQWGSYFRQFWDVSGYLDDEETDLKALREKLKDIPPLHRWSKFSHLGDHDHRDTGESEDEVVLVIRGELLKKYPTAVIYAHRARWQRHEDGTINNKVERRLEDPAAAGATNPPRDKVKTPLYEAKVEPDIYFFGFDLTVEEAVGGSGEDETDDPGWFFVIKERPGEPRFGLDIAQADHIYVWNDLGWGNIVPDTSPGDYIEINNSTPTITLESLPPDQTEQTAQAQDDKFVKWHKDTHAAELAYILYQAPVMVAVHAAEMLPRE